MLKQCIKARAALAELKQAAELIPNQTMLINTLPLLEAKDSSEIENIVTTADQLFQYAQDPLVRMAVGYYQFEAIHPFADGNGRTGRVLNILYLIQAELLTLPILFIHPKLMQLLSRDSNAFTPYA